VPDHAPSRACGSGDAAHIDAIITVRLELIPIDADFIGGADRQRRARRADRRGAIGADGRCQRICTGVAA